jgi:cation diffusion facilitator CzcD-associated flavoprotein CzcO
MGVTATAANSKVQHQDVIIVGAGISGLGAACHLQRESPDRNYVILEGRGAIGGTWDLFRYPGIRSDSDLYTFGYDFKPWHGQPIAEAKEILNYLHEVVEENALQPNIRFDHWVDNAAWSSDTALWTVQANDGDGQLQTFTANFLFMCQGYYDYEAGYRPNFPGEENFKGPIIHPQQWPEDLDYTNKHMVVIGSGATAATILPAVADKVAKVTQLQRSPSYYFSLDNSVEDEMIEELRSLEVPQDWIHGIKRRKMLEVGRETAERSKSEPDVLARELIDAAAEILPEGYPVDTHFTPKYSPWDERLCMLPDGDMLHAIASGKAAMVTDHIDHFVEEGIKLKSGEVLPADIIVAATGIELCGLGKIRFNVDGKDINLNDHWTYKGIMMSGVPNLAWIFGYIRTSWTMRSDLIGHYVCRLLNHMADTGMRQCTPTLRAQDNGMNGRGYIDEEDFAPGYMQRGMSRLPQQSDQAPWTNSQDYYKEKDELPDAGFDDGVLVFGNSDPGSNTNSDTNNKTQAA